MSVRRRVLSVDECASILRACCRRPPLPRAAAEGPAEFGIILHNITIDRRRPGGNQFKTILVKFTTATEIDLKLFRVKNLTDRLNRIGSSW